MGKEFVAGLSFSDTAAQIAVLELRRDRVVVVHLGEYKNGQREELWFLESLFQSNGKLFKKVSKVSIALDNAEVVLHSFPMDSSLHHADRQEHTQWELSNFIQDFQPKEYINDVHVLRTHVQEHTVDMFVVVARRSLAQQVQRALGEHKYDLHLLDTNHFAGQYALAVNYPEVKEKTIILASIAEQRLDVGTLQAGKLIAYRYFISASSEENIKRLNEYCQQAGVNEVYIYGSGCTLAFTKALIAQRGLKITTVNPFRRVPITDALRETGIMLGQEHKFVASVGVALRKE